MDSRYYVSDKYLQFLVNNDLKQRLRGNTFRFKPATGNGIARMITTKAGQRMEDDYITEEVIVDIQNDDVIKLRELTINQPDAFRIYSSINGCTRTLKANGGGLGAKTGLYLVWNGKFWAVRKLTPRECFRCMGFTGEDADLLSKNKISDTQLYKMAGNSIVVDVLMALFRNLQNTLY